MKDLNKEEMEKLPFAISIAEDLIEDCLAALAEDKEHSMDDKVVEGLTFRKLIDTLKVADSELSVYGNLFGPTTRELL